MYPRADGLRKKRNCRFALHVMFPTHDHLPFFFYFFFIFFSIFFRLYCIKTCTVVVSSKPEKKANELGYLLLLLGLFFSLPLFISACSFAGIGLAIVSVTLTLFIRFSHLPLTILYSRPMRFPFSYISQAEPHEYWAPHLPPTNHLSHRSLRTNVPILLFLFGCFELETCLPTYIYTPPSLTTLLPLFPDFLILSAYPASILDSFCVCV